MVTILFAQVLGLPLRDSDEFFALPRILISKLKWLSRRVLVCYFEGPPIGTEALPLQVLIVIGRDVEAAEKSAASDASASASKM